MTLDINGSTVQTSNNALSMTANSITGLNINSLNFPVQSNRPYFAANGTTAAWQNLTSANWTIIVLNATNINNGSGYSTSTGAFTAPVSGTYYFEYSLYCQKAGATPLATDYTHPLFIINGSFTTRQSAQAGSYRLRARTNSDGNYAFDTQINDIFYLAAGDYVQPYVYSNRDLQQWYPPYAQFGGFLIG
jgi:hypothetical protein